MENVNELNKRLNQLKKEIAKYVTAEGSENEEKAVTECKTLVSYLKSAEFWLNEEGMLRMVDTVTNTNGRRNLEIKKDIYLKDLKELLKEKDPEGVKESIRELKPLCREYIEIQDMLEDAEED